MGDGIDTEGKAADDDDTGLGELTSDLLSDFSAVRGRTTTADDRHGLCITGGKLSDKV